MNKKIITITAALAGMAFSGAVQAGLVAEWNFDGQNLANSGAAGAIHDGAVISGAATNANAVSASYTTDTPSGSGYALNLSSTAQYLSISNSSSLAAGYADTFDAATNFTFSLWVKSTDGTWNASWNEFGGKGSEDNDEGWAMRARNFGEGWGTMVSFFKTPDDEVKDSVSPVNVIDQTWHLLTYSYAAATGDLTLYIDGVQKAVSTGTTLLDASSRFLVFGARDNGTRNDNLLYDHIQFYDHVLTASEVSALYIEQADFFVDSTEIALNLYSPETVITGSVAVSYIANSSLDVAVSISDETHPGAFSLVNTTPMTLMDPSPSNTVLAFVFDNATAGLSDGESATGLVTIAWNLMGDTEVTEVLLPISARYEVVAPGPILWDIGIPSNGADIPSAAADFVAAGVTEYIGDATVANVAAAQNMADAGISVSLSAYAGSYIPGATYTGAGASIMKEYIYNKGNSVITIGGLSLRLTENTDYSLYVWGKGDAVDQTAIFTYDGVSTETSTNDVFTSDATNFMAKFSFTTDAAVADTLTIGWDRVSTYTAFSGFAIVPVNYIDPNPEVGEVSMEIAAGGTEMVLRWDTTFNAKYGIMACDNLT
uniref:LamG-like jellyroll fold domain-containing protein n=1 Tax=Pontiella sp. TaxID=2837462 RepID=UPI003568497B